MKHLQFLGLACVALASTVHADDTNVEQVLVTATRMEIPVTEALTSVIVIDREQIERSVASDVAELLRFHAGLDIGRNGGPGQTTSLFLRGSESNHTLVLVDGVEINPGTLGGAALQNISPRLIERIEIVKGPRSSLYGSEAIGGVINIITRSAPGFSARAGAGRYGTRELSLSAGQRFAQGQLALSLSSSESDGFPTVKADGLPDRGFDNLSIGLNASTGVGPGTVALRHWQSSGETEYFDFFVNPLTQDYNNQATALEWNTPLSHNWSSSLTLSRIEDEIEQRQSADFVTTTRNVLEWQNTVAAGDVHNIVAGVYLAREETQAQSFGSGFDQETDTNAVFVEDFMRFGPNRLLLATRFTDHQSFGSQATWNIEIGRYLADNLKITAAAGTGFRAPDATDRFGFGGNPDLEAESSESLEVGLTHSWDSQSVAIHGFQTNIDELIEFVFDPVTFDGRNVNTARARIRGLELRHDWREGPWQLTTTALLQDPKDRDSGAQLARRAKKTLTLNLGRQIGEHGIGLDLLATGDRPDSPFSTIENAGYVLASLNGYYQLSNHWLLRARLDNLLDSDYETAAGFRSAGRGLYVSAQYRAN